MAQLAMAQNGNQAPAILSRIKTQAVEKNVFVRVEVLPSDLEELKISSDLFQLLLSQQSQKK